MDSKRNFNNILLIKYSPLKPKAFNSTNDLSFYIKAASKRRFLPLRAEMLKFLASLSSCKTFLRIAEQRSVRVLKTRKSVGKPNAEWLVREKTVKSNSEKSSRSLNCFSFLTGLGIKAKSTKCKSAILICLTEFSSDYPPISDLIHLARCVKFNP